MALEYHNPKITNILSYARPKRKTTITTLPSSGTNWWNLGIRIERYVLNKKPNPPINPPTRVGGWVGGAQQGDTPLGLTLPRIGNKEGPGPRTEKALGF